ncbi:helix-turn-helix domain-containing protein [Meridianimarinicoccus aquatilis]|uniref:XRE family transcriptional regulator n=1 Tax=Meridianimarinicoccus aquatilis TaxID=2552766 RepID=A0A4V3BCG1_9RHOB|nr:helix-turn-helix transcriptional regulator [Fluviibacterium aquatile]TDL90849.1 XRE family transcriptional regulator [Fluviibacterium aquatile]
MSDDLRKVFAGARIRHLRQTKKMTQAEFAENLGLSTSYLNQIENNNRSLSASVILALFNRFGFDLSDLALDESGKIAVDLGEILADPVFADTKIMPQELKIAVLNTPNMVRAFLGLHRAFQKSREQLGHLDTTLTETEASVAPMPYEEVRDYFHYKDNYIDELDREAEKFARTISQTDRQRYTLLADYLSDAHGIRVVETKSAAEAGAIRRFDPVTQTLHLSATSTAATNYFQMAYQVGLLEQGALIEKLLDEAGFHTQSAREVCRMTFANYFAGAVVLPYKEFVEAASEMRHDLDRLAFRFDASREQVCHRLSMLQRPGQKGVPFYFLRIDRAGNITKRHSATSLQFTRFGGSCPLWNIHAAFEGHGEILRQLASTPDGLRYVCLAFSKTIQSSAFGKTSRKYAIGLGCEAKYAGQLVYADDLDVSDPQRFEPIGTGCRICERSNCGHRSVPPLARDIKVDHHSRNVVPFQVD